jgi:hypothetical protein
MVKVFWVMTGRVVNRVVRPETMQMAMRLVRVLRLGLFEGGL